jgi:hypothetical protein
MADQLEDTDLTNSPRVSLEQLQADLDAMLDNDAAYIMAMCCNTAMEANVRFKDKMYLSASQIQAVSTFVRMLLPPQRQTTKDTVRDTHADRTRPFGAKRTVP